MFNDQCTYSIIKLSLGNTHSSKSMNHVFRTNPAIIVWLEVYGFVFAKHLRCWQSLCHLLFQWYVRMLHFASATWRTNWRTRSKEPDWRGRPWASCWMLWVSKRRTFKRSRAFWKENWRSDWTCNAAHAHTCAHICCPKIWTFFLRCNRVL